MTNTEFRSAFRRAISRLAWLVVFAVLGRADLAFAQVLETYKIQPTDIVVIEVVNEPQLGGKEFRVSASGEISYPFIGSIKAADRTPTEVQADVKRLLEADYLVNAQVIVQVKEYRKQFVSVTGQVNRPGIVEIPPERRLTVVEAVAMAGGFTRLARNEVILIRQGMKDPLRFKEDDLKNSDRKPFYVESGDVLNIPESRI